MLRQRADSKSLGCVVSSIDDCELVFLGVNCGPMRTLANNEGVDLHLTCFRESFSRRAGTSTNCPSLRFAVPSDLGRPYIAPVILCKLANSLNEYGCLDLALPAYANEDSFESGESRAWFQAQLFREQHVVAKCRMPIERQM